MIVKFTMGTIKIFTDKFYFVLNQLDNYLQKKNPRNNFLEKSLKYVISSYYKTFFKGLGGSLR